MRKGFVRLVTVVLTAGLAGSCGDADMEASAEGEAESAAEVDDEVASGGTLDCSAFPEDMINKVGWTYAMVLQVDPERNLESMEETGSLPDPAILRTFADAFEQLDISEIRAMQFDAPAVTAPGQRQLADLLEAALAARDDPADPAWFEFRTFVSENATRQQLSMSYYLGEAGCV